MSPIKRTLLIIALFLILSIGSFIWYVVSWEAGQPSTFGEVTEPQSQTPSLFSDLKKSRGSGGWPPVPHPQPAGHLS